MLEYHVYQLNLQSLLLHYFIGYQEVGGIKQVVSYRKIEVCINRLIHLSSSVFVYECVSSSSSFFFSGMGCGVGGYMDEVLVHVSNLLH